MVGDTFVGGLAAVEALNATDTSDAVVAALRWAGYSFDLPSFAADATGDDEVADFSAVGGAANTSATLLPAPSAGTEAPTRAACLPTSVLVSLPLWGHVLPHSVRMGPRDTAAGDFVFDFRVAKLPRGTDPKTGQPVMPGHWPQLIRGKPSTVAALSWLREHRPPPAASAESARPQQQSGATAAGAAATLAQSANPPHAAAAAAEGAAAAGAEQTEQPRLDAAALRRLGTAPVLHYQRPPSGDEAAAAAA